MKKSTPKESMSVVSGILGFLRDRGKTELLPLVALGLDEAVDTSNERKKIVITSAVPLSKDQIQSIKDSITRFLKRDVPAVNRVDKDLIGGFFVRVGDFFLDASLVSELNAVKQTLLS